MKIRSALALILAVVTFSSVPAKANLISNGGFEGGNFWFWDYQPSNASVAVHFFTDVLPHSGLYSAEIAGVTANTLSQTVADTLNQSYLVSFWWFQSGAASLNVTWGGTSVFSETSPNSTVYQLVTAIVSGSGSDMLAFTSSSGGGKLYIDDVSLTALDVTATPLPAALPLFASGAAALGLFGLRNRRKGKSAQAA